MDMLKRGIGRTSFLSKDEMQLIHSQALDLLHSVGVKIEHEKGLELLKDNGADVNFETQVVRFPPDLVEKCLELVPRKMTMAARNPKNDLALEAKGFMHSRNTGGMSHIRDYETGEVREVLLKDVSEFSRLIDGLENFSFVAPLYAADVPVEKCELHVLKTMFNNTEKHVNIRALSVENLRVLAEMGVLVAGSREKLKERPIISLLEAPIAPLRFPHVFVESLFVSGEYGIPIEICSMPNLGASGPITLAGTLLLTVVEHLATYVVGQLAHPDTPIIWAPRYPAMDMSTSLTGLLVECGLACAAAAQMAVEHYNLVCDLHGPATNAVIPDGESLVEATFAALTTAYAGPSILCGGGALELGLVASLEQAVLDNEVHGIARRIMSGFEVDQDRLASEAITRVGISGHYLADEHTLKYLRDEHVKTRLLKPKTRSGWIAGGSKGIVDLARDEVKTILNKNYPEQLDSSLNRELDALINRS